MHCQAHSANPVIFTAIHRMNASMNAQSPQSMPEIQVTSSIRSSISHPDPPSFLHIKPTKIYLHMLGPALYILTSPTYYTSFTYTQALTQYQSFTTYTGRLHSASPLLSTCSLRSIRPLHSIDSSHASVFRITMCRRWGESTTKRRLSARSRHMPPSPN
jgi:hypothetical protein